MITRRLRYAGRRLALLRGRLILLALTLLLLLLAALGLRLGGLLGLRGFLVSLELARVVFSLLLGLRCCELHLRHRDVDRHGRPVRETKDFLRALGPNQGHAVGQCRECPLDLFADFLLTLRLQRSRCNHRLPIAGGARVVLRLGPLHIPLPSLQLLLGEEEDDPLTGLGEGHLARGELVASCLETLGELPIVDVGCDEIVASRDKGRGRLLLLRLRLFGGGRLQLLLLLFLLFGGDLLCRDRDVDPHGRLVRPTEDLLTAVLAVEVLDPVGQLPGEEALLDVLGFLAEPIFGPLLLEMRLRARRENGRGDGDANGGLRAVLLLDEPRLVAIAAHLMLRLERQERPAAPALALDLASFEFRHDLAAGFDLLALLLLEAGDTVLLTGDRLEVPVA